MSNLCTSNPTPAANQPSIYTHTYLTSAYKYLVCERKRYIRGTKSYHSISAALYCLDVLINKYWPGSKSHKETYSHIEYDTDNYLYMWYSTMTRACNRRLNPHQNMISNIIFIRDLVGVLPDDKKKDLIKVENEKSNNCNCGCHHTNYNSHDQFKMYWIEALLEKLETARWCATIFSTNNIDNNMKQASEKINDIMSDICNQHNLKMERYHIHSLDGFNKFGTSPEIHCIRALHDIKEEIDNIHLAYGNGDSYNWVGLLTQNKISDLINELTQIYYK